MVDNSIYEQELSLLEAAVSNIGYKVRLVNGNTFYQALLSPKYVGSRPVISVESIDSLLALGYGFRSVFYDNNTLYAMFVKFL